MILDLPPMDFHGGVIGLGRHPDRLPAHSGTTAEWQI
jgi:hypothetical protein